MLFVTNKKTNDVHFVLDEKQLQSMYPDGLDDIEIFKLSPSEVMIKYLESVKTITKEI